jgi:hypothetical protein
VLDNKDGEDLPAHASMAVDWIDKQKGEFPKQVTGRAEAARTLGRDDGRVFWDPALESRRRLCGGCTGGCWSSTSSR